MKNIQDRYDFNSIEQKWIKIWEEKKAFQPSFEAQETFSVVIPPPNVTGSLHIGHALNHTLQDIIIRIERKKGKKTIWVPGMDHAGIATQIVVEKELAQKNQKRTDFSRDEFIQKIWEWKKFSGGKIKEQQRLLGESVDWSKEKFTLDKNFSKAVYKVFKTLYDEGLIYRGKYLVNWDPTLKTAVSDLEVVYQEEDGYMHYVKYPFVDGTGFMEIATTRPETILADGALAVNPKDIRYKNLLGKMVWVPLTDRKIPIICDDYVDMNFGSGCVKITPAHDFNDWEIGKRHKMEIINLFTVEAKMNENAPKAYHGLDRFAARKQIIQDLDKNGLLVKIKEHKINLPRADRTKVIVEPYLTNQWFVKTQPLAKAAIEVVKNKKIEFYPKMWEKTYFEWMENIKDWCISRQLWWGHRIPAYYCLDCNTMEISENEIDKCSSCSSKNIKQDEDVLDTWFSSALWPFGIFDWPQKTKELQDFYPNNVLVTGFDIIFFWVARMIMMGLRFMGEIPFHKVIIHGLIRDKNRKKFSKSVGNVIDPLEMMKKYGTDSFRFFLAVTLPEGKDIIFDENRLDGYKAFCNKVWNSSRFILMNLPENFIEKEIDIQQLDFIDIWILVEFNRCLEDYHKAYQKYRFFDMVQVIYDFIWSSFCDWYIELSKPRIYKKVSKQEKGICEQILVSVLKKSLGLLHPIMPFITEEIYSHFSDDLLTTSFFPKPYNLNMNQFQESLQKMFLLQQIVGVIRKERAETNIPPHKKIEFTVISENQTVQSLKNKTIYFQNLTNASKIDFKQSTITKKTDKILTFDDGKLIFSSENFIDITQEKIKLNKEKQKIQIEIDRIEKKLKNENFVKKAKEEVVVQQRKKLFLYQTKLKNIKERQRLCL